MEQQRSKEWFQKRKGRISGSIAGACLGLSPWLSKEDVMRSLVRDQLGAEREMETNAAMQWGVINEDNAISDLELDHGFTVFETGFNTYEDWLGASPDGLIGDDTVLEVKTPYSKRNGGEFKSLEEQPYYYAQVQLEMLCTGRTKAIFYQWSPFSSRIEYINHDTDWLEENIPKLKAFYNQFQEELKNPQKHLEPKIPVIKDDLFEALVYERKQLLEAAERLKEVEKQIKSFGPCEGYGVKVSKVVRKGSVDYKSIPELKGVDLEQYRKKPSEYLCIR